MALDYLQVPNDYDHLLKLLRVQPIGAPFGNLRFLSALGVSVLVEKGELENLRLNLEIGLPSIVFVATAQLSYWRETTGHAAVVVGLDEEKVYLNDPAFPDAPKQVPIDEFVLAWIDADQFYALIRLA
jgi:hypothetical protein